MTVEEIKELTAKVQELKRRHKEEMEVHMESAIGHLEKARNAEEVQTKKLLVGFEVEKRKHDPHGAAGPPPRRNENVRGQVQGRN